MQRALPGECVRARAEHRGRAATYGRVLEVLAPSPSRRPLPCVQATRCGGCPLIHAHEDAQRALLKTWLEGWLEPEHAARLEEVQAAPSPWAYRALAKFVVGNGGVLGSYAPRSHDVVSMEGCQVHLPVIEDAAGALRAAWRGQDVGVKYVVARASVAEQRVGLTFVVPRAPADGLERGLAAVRALQAVVRADVHLRPEHDDVILGDGPTRLAFARGPLTERVGPLRVDLASGAFSQVHPAMAERLQAFAVQSLLPQGKRVADLYAGMGVLAAWSLAEGAVSAVAVEARLAAAHSALRAEGLTMVHAQTEDAFDAWRRAQVVVANPPRRGLSPEVVRQLLASDAERLVYVSCGPKTLARDLAALGDGFVVERLRPFELFPQTAHVETVAVLQRAP